MGKTDGFLLYDRQEDPYRDVNVRILDYEEIHCPQKEEVRKQQAARCMNCGVPYCQSGVRLSGMTIGCPLHNLIPEWNDEIWLGNCQHALGRLLKTNPFPEFTGRVCPALCEKACVNGADGDPVTIRDNERFLIEKAFQEGWMKPCVPAVRSGKTAAVIGSGPAGLAAAHRLNLRGHDVTVYERDDRIGGLLMYGIPGMKLDKKVSRRRQELMEKEGIRFVLNTAAGRDVSGDELRDSYDAVILACGAKQARKPAIAGMDEADGVIYAVDYLTRETKDLLDHTGRISVSGKHVIILGGGDTGNDCVASCVRGGAASVRQIEMMKRPPSERLPDNPWPEWPKTLKTDYGQKEAAAVYGEDPRRFSATVTELICENGVLSAAQLAEVTTEQGKLKISEEGRETVPCDLLIIAAGFTGCEKETADWFHVPLTERNTVQTDSGTYQTERPGVFACGDMRTGQSLVVHAINDGRRCAKEVDRYLMGYTNLI